jgi:cytidylate kinase
MTVETLIVAIDGPSGVGKSTVARKVAQRLGVPYLSTGAMYRALLALEVLASGTDPKDRAAVEELVRTVDLTLVVDGSTLRVLVDGEDPGPRAYSLGVSQVTSRISAYSGVRELMVELQRRGAALQGAVLEGRDIGTRVFPETPNKFFLEASPDVRATRRWRQLPDAAREKVDRADVLREVLARDQRDSNRTESPLTRDSSYILIETDNRSAEEVADLIVERVLADPG